MSQRILHRLKVVAGLWLLAAGACLGSTAFAQDWNAAGGPEAGAAEAVGPYAAGCMIGAAALPADGEGYQVIRLSRERYFGHPDLIHFVVRLAGQVADAGLGTLTVGDLSQRRGGPMIAAHASHQIGLDVDIFLRLDLPQLPPSEREQLSLPSFVDRGTQRVSAEFDDAHAQLLRLAATDPDVARIFVHPAIKLALCERDWPDRSFLRTLRPWFGHDDHLHVRLNCPPDSAECVAQPAPPPGDGCGAELVSWFGPEPVPSRPPGARSAPQLPPRCEASR